jgi:hypothetical protein
MSRSYTTLPPSASMACSGIALPFFFTSQVVPWLRSLVAGLSPRRPGSVQVGFVVDKVALGQVFL